MANKANVGIAHFDSSE